MFVVFMRFYWLIVQLRGTNSLELFIAQDNQRLYTSQVVIQSLNMHSGIINGKRRKKEYELFCLINYYVEQVYFQPYQFIMINRASAILQAKHIKQNPTSFSTLVLHNPENSQLQCNDLHLNLDQELHSLPTNLDVHSFHIQTNSSEDYSQEEDEVFEVYRPKVNFDRSTYFHSEDSQLSQIKECNNQSSSIIYHPAKKAAIVNMPDIIQERNWMNSRQKWRDSRDSMADEKQSNGDAETAVESEIRNKQPVKQAWSSINVRTIVLVYLLVFIAAALYSMFKPSQRNMNKGGKVGQERKDKWVPTKGKKASKAK